MPRKRAEPSIEVRRYRLADGTWTETFSVRYYDAAGTRRRRAFASMEEADFERARIVLEQSQNGGARPPAPDVEPEAASMTVAAFWASWIADARTRLQRRTVFEYERQFRNRLEPRFGSLALDALKPRMVSEWRAELVAEGVGPEAIRRAMTLLQAMYTVAIEWGEATANPVSVVRKPKQGRRRVVHRSRRRESSVFDVSSFASKTSAQRRSSASSHTRGCGRARRSDSSCATSASGRSSSSRRSATAT